LIILDGMDHKRLEKLGYNIPRYKNEYYKWVVKKGTEILVKVEDLPKRSMVKVRYKCDYCNGVNQIDEKSKWKVYKDLMMERERNSNEKDCCKKCAARRSRKTITINKLKNGNSLAEKFPNLIKEWSTKNKRTPWDYTFGSDQIVWWKCSNGHEWQAKITKRTNCDNCPYCSGVKVCLDNCVASNFPELLKEWHPIKNGKLTPFDVTCGSGQHVWWVCEFGHEWQSTVVHRTKDKSGCPKCKNYKQVLRQRDDIKKVYVNVENKGFKFIKWVEEYYNAKSKFIVMCDNNHEFITCNAYIRNNRGCPYCDETKGEKRIRKWLEENKIKFEPQKEFEGLIGLRDGLLSYDFFLPIQNILIEYQGEFHDGKANNFVKENLNVQQEHDRRKKEYAESHNIKLLEIWYWQFANIEEILERRLI
jgi:hypothetical protein